MAVYFYNEHVLLYSDEQKKLNLAIRKSKEMTNLEIPFWRSGKDSSHRYRSDNSCSDGHTAIIASHPIKVGNRNYAPIKNVKVIGPPETVKAFLMFESHDISGCLGFLLQHRLITVERPYINLHALESVVSYK